MSPSRTASSRSPSGISTSTSRPSGWRRGHRPDWHRGRFIGSQRSERSSEDSRRPSRHESDPCVRSDPSRIRRVRAYCTWRTQGRATSRLQFQSTDSVLLLPALQFQLESHPSCLFELKPAEETTPLEPYASRIRHVQLRLTFSSRVLRKRNSRNDHARRTAKRIRLVQLLCGTLRRAVTVCLRQPPLRSADST